MTDIYKFSNAGGVKSLNRYLTMLAGNATFNPTSYYSIASGNVGGQTSILFSDIPQTYSHLQIRVFGRTNTANTYEQVYLYNFNNNSGSSGSATHTLTGDGSNQYGTGQTGQYSSFLGNVPAASSSANFFGCSITDILDYTSSNKLKTIRSIYGYDISGAGQVGLVSNLPVTLPGSNPVTTLQVSLSSGNTFATNSYIALYGIK